MSEGKAMQTENQNKTKVSVQGVPETMLQTLFARAAESRKENHNIYDEKAIEIVSRLDYDFSKAESDKLMSSGVINLNLRYSFGLAFPFSKTTIEATEW